MVFLCFFCVCFLGFRFIFFWFAQDFAQILVWFARVFCYFCSACLWFSCFFVSYMFPVSLMRGFCSFAMVFCVFVCVSGSSLVFVFLSLSLPSGFRLFLNVEPDCLKSFGDYE